MARNEQNNEAFSASLMRPFVAFGVIMAFSTQPMIHDADPWLLSVAGFVTALSFASLLLAQVFDETPSRSKLRWTFAAIGAGFLLFVVAMIDANITGNRNDDQCGLLEIDMMRVHPARADSHDLYQALQCRQQSRGTLWFPANKGFK